MATCIRCGTTLAEGQRACASCGQDSEPEDVDLGAPVGTWSSHDDEATPPLGSFPETRHAAPGRDRGEDGGDREDTDATDDELDSGEFTLTPARRFTLHDGGRAEKPRPPDITPLPHAATALAWIEEPNRPPDATQSRQSRKATPSSVRRSDAEVLPLRPKSERVADSVTPAENAAFTEPPPRPTAPPTMKPPVLASQLLKAYEQPAEPGQSALRWLGAALCALGAVGTGLLGGTDFFTVATAALLMVAAGLCTVPIGYATRASLVVALAILGMSLATYARITAGAPMSEPLLALATIILSGGLFFRAFYPASRVARLAVALGMTVLVMWFIDTGGFSGLTSLGIEWTSWAPAAIRIGFGLLLLLSLLAFMDRSTSGGTRVWGAGLLVWYSLHMGVQLAVHYSQAHAVLPDPLAGVALANSVLVVVGGLAVAQLLASLVAAYSDH